MTPMAFTTMVIRTAVMTMMIRIRTNWHLPETTQALPLLAGNSSLKEIASRLITGFAHPHTKSFNRATT